MQYGINFYCIAILYIYTFMIQIKTICVNKCAVFCALRLCMIVCFCVCVLFCVLFSVIFYVLHNCCILCSVHVLCVCMLCAGCVQVYCVYFFSVHVHIVVHGYVCMIVYLVSVFCVEVSLLYRLRFVELNPIPPYMVTYAGIG